MLICDCWIWAVALGSSRSYQAAWRPGYIRVGVVWLVASCCFLWRVIRVANWGVWDLSRAVFWALDSGLVFGRQLSGGWGSNRAGVILIFGGAVFAVAVSVIAWSLGSGCGLKLGRQAAWRPRCKWVGVVKLVGGTVLAVAV